MSHVCARCPRLLGVSCCEAPEGQALATLTDEDVRRISGETRLSAGRFVVDEWLSPEEAQAYEEQRPLFRGYFRRGSRRRTLKVEKGACVFLDRNSGCRLSEAARPLACRLYPFHLLPDGSWSILPPRYGVLSEAREGRDGCLAVEEADGMEALHAAFSLSPEALESLAAALRAAVARHDRG
ncbi:MAG: YkgJ family cysteine cluster protein [Myxococcota bacterium]|nr:YkgJ family cysteine cluster protein [Myxococcota bacterium]